MSTAIHKEITKKADTAVHSRKTNQNNFGLDMGGIFHHGEGQTCQRVVQRGCAASVLGGLQDLTDHGKKKIPEQPGLILLGAEG